MALKNRFLFIIGILLLFSFSRCDKSPSDSEPEESKLPNSVEISSPSANTTYWDDKPVDCATNQAEFADKTSWLLDGEPISCSNDQFAQNFSAGEHIVTVRIVAEGESIENNVEITVKEGFSVSVDNPENDSEFFVGDEVSCEATVDPEKYEEYLEISVNGKSCTDDTVRLESAGQPVFSASATVDNRTESDEATVTVNPVVAGKVYPLTSDGVSGQAGNFSVTLRADGEVIDTQTTTDGSFAIKSERISELGDEEVELEVAQSSDFYGARAVLPASELLALVESGELGFVLAPQRWHIRDGKLAGRSTNLKLRAAFTRVIPNDPGTSFYRLRRIGSENGEGEPTYMYLGVPPEYRPFATAFNRAESSAEVTASDSTSFWKESNDVLEPDLDRGNLYTAATLAQVPTTSDGVHVTADEPDGISRAGPTIDRRDGNVILVGGVIHLDIDRFGPSSTGTQQHEQLHVYGFGHASGWDGQMTLDAFIDRKTGERHTDHPGSGTNYLTVDDVAHIQFYMDALDLQRKLGTSFGMLETMLALNIPGLPPKDGGQKALGKHTGFPIHQKIECAVH